MDTLSNYFEMLHETLGPGTLIVICIIVFIGIVGQWALYSKCDLPGIACIVPFWNVVVFLKIMGRPWYHMFFFLIPLYNIYFVFKVYIELCQSFGKTSTTDYILVVLLNGLYVLNLALSYDTKYVGPVYGKEKAAASEAVAA